MKASRLLAIAVLTTSVALPFVAVMAVAAASRASDPQPTCRPDSAEAGSPLLSLDLPLCVDIGVVYSEGDRPLIGVGLPTAAAALTPCPGYTDVYGSDQTPCPVPPFTPVAMVTCPGQPALVVDPASGCPVAPVQAKTPSPVITPSPAFTPSPSPSGTAPSPAPTQKDPTDKPSDKPSQQDSAPPKQDQPQPKNEQQPGASKPGGGGQPGGGEPGGGQPGGGQPGGGEPGGGGQPGGGEPGGGRPGGGEPGGGQPGGGEPGAGRPGGGQPGEGRPGGGQPGRRTSAQVAPAVPQQRQDPAQPAQAARGSYDAPGAAEEETALESFDERREGMDRRKAVVVVFTGVVTVAAVSALSRRTGMIRRRG